MQYNTKLFSAFSALAIFLLLMPAPSQAQMTSKTESRFKPGIRAGIQSSTIRSMDIYQKLVSYHAGIQLLIDSRKAWAIQPELLYVRGGWKLPGSSRVTSVETTLEVDYVQFNAIGKVRLPTNGAVQPTVFIGPALSRVVNRNVISTAYKPDDHGIDEVDDFRISVESGVGMDITMGTHVLMIEGRYGLGFSTPKNQRFYLSTAFSY